MPAITIDTFFKGRIAIQQHRRGYRFSIDAVLLAGCIGSLKSEKILDLGTGCGIIPILLAYRYASIQVYGVEVQAELAALARQNVRSNAMQDRIHILHRDMITLTAKHTRGPVDIVVSNPPFRKVHSGRINPRQEKAIARHEIAMTLSDLVDVSRQMLSTKGRMITIYPSERSVDLMVQMRRGGIEPKFVHVVHSRPNEAAKLIVIDGIKGGRPGVKLMPPLIVYQPDGQYSATVQAMMRP